MITILGIESSCDDTSAAVIHDGVILSNVIAGQAVHERYGGVVPELASRAHQQNIIPVVHDALKQAGSIQRGGNCSGLHPRSRPAGIAARGHLLRKRILLGAEHPHGRGKSPAGTCAGAFYQGR